MPSVRYYNASAPFWDFVTEMENQASNNNDNRTSDGEEGENEDPHPWGGAWGGAPWGAFPFRGRHHHGRHHHGPPPPPPNGEGETDPEEGPSSPRGPPPPFTEKADESGPEHPRGPHGHGHGHGPQRRCGPGARGGWGGRGRGGPFGGRGRGHFHPYAMGPFGPIAEMFQAQLFGSDENNNDTTSKDAKDETFQPEVDVFDTPEAFVVHISLPGAKKEDVGVNWDADKSELSIGGVVYRPGDEEFLKTLALDERKIGAFERKVRLGSRANPAQVDVEGIRARMEDGVLTVEVPKLDGDFVEVRKVDIE